MQTNCVESCHAQTVVLMLDYNENCSKTKTRLIQFESCTRVRDDWACQVSVGQPSLTHACTFRVDLALCASELSHAKEQQFPAVGVSRRNPATGAAGVGERGRRGKRRRRGRRGLIACLLISEQLQQCSCVCVVGPGLCCWFVCCFFV